jgi:hypothetical protein
LFVGVVALIKFATRQPTAGAMSLSIHQPSARVVCVLTTTALMTIHTTA